MDEFESGPRAILFGFRLGFACSLLYGQAFLVFALFRLVIQAVRVLEPSQARWITVFGDTVDILILALTFALLIGIPAGLVQGSTVFLIYGLSLLGKGGPRWGAWGGLMISTGLILLLHLQLLSSVSGLQAIFWRSLQAYTFWLGLPGLIFIVTTTWAGWKVWNSRLPSRIVRLSPV